MDIVIVDDDKLVASSLKIILEADPEVKVAAMGYSGAEAMALYRQHRPDILLLDIRMGEMSGLEAAKRILEEDGSALILFLTTFSDDEYIIKALKIGARGYLLKQDFAGILPALARQFCPGRPCSAVRLSPVCPISWMRREKRAGRITVPSGSVNGNGK